MFLKRPGELERMLLELCEPREICKPFDRRGRLPNTEVLAVIAVAAI